MAKTAVANPGYPSPKGAGRTAPLRGATMRPMGYRWTVYGYVPKTFPGEIPTPPNLIRIASLKRKTPKLVVVPKDQVSVGVAAELLAKSVLHQESQEPMNTAENSPVKTD